MKKKENHIVLLRESNTYDGRIFLKIGIEMQSQNCKFLFWKFKKSNSFTYFSWFFGKSELEQKIAILYFNKQNVDM